MERSWKQGSARSTAVARSFLQEGSRGGWGRDVVTPFLLLSPLSPSRILHVSISASAQYMTPSTLPQ